MAPEESQSYKGVEELLGSPEIRAMLTALKKEVGSIDEAKLTVELADKLKAQLEKGTKIIMQNAREARAELLMSIQQGEIKGQKEAVTVLAKIIQEEIIEGKMKIEDLKALSVEELQAIEEKTPGILLFAFTSWGEKHANISIEDFEYYKEPAENVELEIDFRGNEDAYYRLGADDLFPPEVRRITVIPVDGGPIRTSTRRVGLKGGDKSGFFDDNGYIPIFTGDIVVVGGAPEYFEEAGIDGENPGVDMTIREDYFNEKTGEWDYDAYEEDHSEEENEFLIETWERSTGIEYEGDIFDPQLAQQMRLKTNINSGNIHDVIDAHPDWFKAAQDAAAEYEEQFNIKIDPAVIYAIIKYESGFQAQIPNQQGSGALGLGQFMPFTWESSDGQGERGFLAENEALVERLLGHPLPTDRAERLALRKNPILSIYATTWYAAQNAETLNLSEISENTAYYIYLAHHDGAGGARTLLQYHRDGKNVELQSWQKRLSPEAYWNMINNLSGAVAVTAGEYRRQLDTGAASHETIETDLTASEVALIGDSNTVGYKKHITIGGEKIPEKNAHAEVGKQIYRMKADLERDIKAGKFKDIKAIVLMGGGNDLADSGPAGRVETITGHLSDMIEMIHAYNPDIKITLITRHPVLDVKQGYYAGRVQEVNQRVLQINNWIRTQAAKHDYIAVVDLYKLVEDPQNAGHVKPDYLGGDGLHLSDKGSQILAQHVGQVVTEPF